jgi:hypothetical protein
MAAHRSPHLFLCLAALGAASLGVTAGCGGAVIPNTDVPDNAENRQVVDFVEEYRHAVEERSPSQILRLVSERYYDDNGTPSTDDDMDFDALRDHFARWGADVMDVRYEMRYRRVTFGADRIFVDFTYTGSFKVRDVEGDRWSRRLADNRIEIVREGDELRIISGL